jgi:D-alanyl-D-alanine carboxypeptidase
MSEERRRDPVYRTVTRVTAYLLSPVACLVAPGRARVTACRWALSLRFPAETLDGLQPAARAAFEEARTRALWRHGELIGLTSGFRTAVRQAALYAEEVRRSGSVAAARRWVLPPGESRHVAGTAMDVRPTEGARWLEEHGGRHGLYRMYDNEWWHFEYCPDGPPVRLPHPGAGSAIDVDRS